MTGFSSNYPAELRERAQYDDGFAAGRRMFDPENVRSGHGYEGEDREGLSSWVCGMIDGWNAAYGEFARSVIAANEARKAGEVSR